MREPPNLTPSCLLMTIAALALAAVGCEEEHIEWLPDSSGFVFTDKGHSRLVQYDVGKKAKRVVVEDAKVKCCWPAVSPDGTQFAMATETNTYTAGSREVVRKTRVVIYDRDGTEKQTSKVFETTYSVTMPAEATGTTAAAGYVCWKGQKDRLLLGEAIYDRAKDKWTRLPAHPYVVPLHAFAPTETGFLAWREVTTQPNTESRAVLSFVDWDGWSTDLDTPKELKILPADLHNFAGLQAKWAGDTYQVITEDGRLTADVGKREVRFAAGVDPTWEALHRPAQYHHLAGGDLYLTVFGRTEGEKEAARTLVSLELQVPEKKKRKVIYAEGEYTSITLFPSPDGKRVAAWCKRLGETEVYDPKQMKYVPRVPPLPAKNTIVVFDDQGEVIDTVDPE